MTVSGAGRAPALGHDIHTAAWHRPHKAFITEHLNGLLSGAFRDPEFLNECLAARQRLARPYLPGHDPLPEHIRQLDVNRHASREGSMSELAIEDTPAVADAAHEAAGGRVVYITEHGERVAAIMPAALAAGLEHLSADELADLLEDFADAAAARAARARVSAGSPLIPWEQVKAKAGL
jgi:antitoxin (DNA-binding transcriptional repressor) of toxin-antitoxin stability system